MIKAADRFIKYVADRIVALVAIVLFLPFFLIIALAIKCDSGGAIVFSQVRSGRGGAEFKIYKFRTMHTTEVPFDSSNPIIDDSNINLTKVGRFLRKSKLDELPQLFNILAGDMSFIGPRPFLPSYIGGYERWELAKFRVLPGLTGLAQVSGNGHLSTKERSYYDAEYAKHRNIIMDINILYSTIMVIFKGEAKFIRHISHDAISDCKENDYKAHYLNIGNSADGKNINRIAQVVGKMEGGVGMCILNYYRNIDRTRYQFDFYTYAPSQYDAEIRAMGGNVYYISNFIKVYKASSEFYRYIKDKHYYAVHANLTTLNVFPLRVAYRCGVKNRICHAHSTTYSSEPTAIVKNILKKFCVKYATVKIACSELASRWMYGILDRDVTIIPNAIDVEKFKRSADLRSAMRSKMGLTSNFVVGTVGRLCYQKNHMYLLDVFSAILVRDKSAKLIIIGDGVARNKLEKKIAKLKLNDSVILINQVECINKYYTIFDVFVLPSRYEGLPLVGIEAQCMGVPCIFSDEITKEVDISNQSAFIGILNRNILEWVSGIEACKNRSLSRFSSTRYDIKKTASALQSVYDNLR